MFLATALMATGIAFGTAGAPNCGASSPPEVSVVPAISGYNLRHDKSSKQLTRKNGGISYEGFKTQGLADVTYATEQSFEHTVWQIGRGRWCGAYTKINVRFGTIKPADVYIASGVKIGTCQYRTVLEHELEHVAISERGIRNTVPLIERSVRQYARNTGVVEAKSQAAVAQKLKRGLNAAITEATSIGIDRTSRQSAEIDTIESYTQLSQLCAGAAY